MSEVAPPTEQSQVSIKAILGQKIGMTQIYDDHGQVIPVTAIQAGPCPITAVLTKEKNGYEALRVGFGSVREKSVNKPDLGQFKKANIAPTRWVREIRTDKASQFQVGQSLSVSAFSPGDYVDVVGMSKGKGFAGVVKRHHFGGGPRTHGQSDRLRAPGSIGSNTFPGRVFKGLRMAGHMGAERCTVQHLEVVRVVPEQNLLLLRGSVPGTTDSVICIRQTVKRVKVRTVPHRESVKKEKAAKKEAPKAAAAAKAKGGK